MKAAEHARLLLRKAAQDEFTIDKLIDDPDSPEEVIGFHAQQAVEKMLKAALKARRVRYRKIHNLGTLVDLAGDAGFPIPPEVAGLCELTPFAAELRYDALPDEGEARFDRQEVRLQLRVLRTWAESIVAGIPG